MKYTKKEVLDKFLEYGFLEHATKRPDKKMYMISEEYIIEWLENFIEFREELKPCPFCGREAEIIDLGDDRITIQTKCKNTCLIQDTGVYHELFKDELIDKWNTRS